MNDTDISEPERLRRLIERAGIEYRERTGSTDFATPTLILRKGTELSAPILGIAVGYGPGFFKVRWRGDAVIVRFSDVVDVRMGKVVEVSA